MNYVVEPKETSCVLRLASQVMRDLQDKKSRNEIIRKLDGDVELFKMVSLFLYGNKWLTRDNKVTEKGKVWLETNSDLGIFARKHA